MSLENSEILHLEKGQKYCNIISSLGLLQITQFLQQKCDSHPEELTQINSRGPLYCSTEMILSFVKKIDFAHGYSLGRPFLPSHVITVGDYANLLHITLDLGFCWDVGLDVDDHIHNTCGCSFSNDISKVK